MKRSRAGVGAMSVGVGVLLAMGLAGCAGGVSNAAACEEGRRALERMAAVTGVEMTSTEGFAKQLTAMEGSAGEIRDLEVSDELREEFSALAEAMDAYAKVGRDSITGTATQAQFDTATLDMLAAGTAMDQACSG